MSAEAEVLMPEPSEGVPTDSVDQACFAANGFLALRSLVGPEEVAFIRGTLERLFANQVGRAEGMLFDFAGPDEGDGKARLPQLLDPRSFAPALLETEFFRKAQEIARSLLGPKARFVADHALLKPARDGAETPWHQDDAFRSGDMEYHEVSVWMPLQTVDDENGCLAFIPGSHRWEVLPHRWVQGDPRIHALECHAGFDPDRAVRCPLPAGGCTVHTNRTLHWAGPNRSDRARLAYVLVFGLPVKRSRAPRNHPWLKDKREPRTDRRRQWMRRGGYAIHLRRRLTQLRHMGWRELTMRVLVKLGYGRIRRHK